MLKEKRYIPLSYDLMFKKVFEDEGDKRPLKRLLKVTLGLDAKNIRILNNEILGENIDSKKTTVDLIVELECGTKISIEMNRTVSKEIIDRNTVFMFRMLGSSLKHSEEYKGLEKHIQINFDMEGYHKKPIDTFKIINTEDIDYVLTDKLEIIKVDVPYFAKRCYNLSNEKLTERDRLIGLIGIEDEQDALKLVDEDDIMKEIVKKIRTFSEEDIMAMSYDRDFHVKQCAKIEAEREADKILKKGMKIINKEKKEIKFQKEQLEEQKEQLETQKEQLEEHKELIRQESIVQEKISIAKNMIKEKIDINVVSKVTGLTIEQIEEL